MVTKSERGNCTLDRQIRSLIIKKNEILKQKDKELFALDLEIEKATKKIAKILMKYDDGDDEDDLIKDGDRVKIIGGVKATINKMMMVHSSTKCYFWLEDEDGKKYRRAKTNVEKVTI